MAQRARDEPGQGGAYRAEPELAAHQSDAGRRAKLTEVGEEPHPLCQDRPPCVRRLDLPAGANEERDTQLGLKRLNPLGHGGRADPKAPGGLGKGAVIDDGYEGFEEAGVHKQVFYRLNT